VFTGLLIIERVIVLKFPSFNFLLLVVHSNEADNLEPTLSRATVPLINGTVKEMLGIGVKTGSYLKNFSWEVR
jgi:hypothetical protein